MLPLPGTNPEQVAVGIEPHRAISVPEIRWPLRRTPSRKSFRTGRIRYFQPVSRLLELAAFYSGTGLLNAPEDNFCSFEHEFDVLKVGHENLSFLVLLHGARF